VTYPEFSVWVKLNGNWTSAFSSNDRADAKRWAREHVSFGGAVEKIELRDQAGTVEPIFDHDLAELGRVTHKPVWVGGRWQCPLFHALRTQLGPCLRSEKGHKQKSHEILTASTMSVTLRGRLPSSGLCGTLFIRRVSALSNGYCDGVTRVPRFCPASSFRNRWRHGVRAIVLQAVRWRG
jgi:hypothetical protein